MKQLGQKLGLGESTISQYENGKREPDIKTIIRISELFQVSVDYLLGQGFDSPADFEKRWTEITGTPHNIDPSKAAPVGGHKIWLLDAFERLNNEGQRKAVERVEELTEIPKYQKNPPQD